MLQVPTKLNTPVPKITHANNHSKAKMYENLNSFESFDKALEHGDKIKDRWGDSFENPLIVIVPPLDILSLLKAAFVLIVNPLLLVTLLHSTAKQQRIFFMSPVFCN